MIDAKFFSTVKVSGLNLIVHPANGGVKSGRSSVPFRSFFRGRNDPEIAGGYYAFGDDAVNSHSETEFKGVSLLIGIVVSNIGSHSSISFLLVIHFVFGAVVRDCMQTRARPLRRPFSTNRHNSG